MLTFNLKHKYFKMYKSGVKNIEYRLACDYWHSRLSKAKIGDTVKLVKGYSAVHLLARLIKINVITHAELPSYVMRLLYRKDKPYYAIHLDVLK